MNIRRFLNEDSGQDIIEHTLLVALLVIFIAIVATGPTGVIGMWNSASTLLSGANTTGS